MTRTAGADMHLRDAGSTVDTQLTASAMPVLDQLTEMLVDQPVGVVLTDPDGAVLVRFTEDDGPGGRPGTPGHHSTPGPHGAPGRQVPGPGDLACFEAPIHHPLSHTTVGLLDLISGDASAGPLLAALATTTAARIEEAILAATEQRDLALIRAYRAACLDAGRPVLATNEYVTLMNETARWTLDPDEQSMVLDRAAESIASGRPRRLRVELAGVGVALLDCTPAWSASDVAGCVITVRPAPPEVGHAAPVAEHRPRENRGAARSPRGGPELPGLAGSSPVWTRCCEDARAAFRTGRPLLLLGEPGVGKAALADALHQERSPAVFTQVLDARDAASSHGWVDGVRAALAVRRGPVVLRRLDQLPPDVIPDLMAVLHVAAARHADDPTPWLIATSSTTDLVGAGSARLLELFPGRVHVPPLRRRLLDLREIVEVLLARLHPRNPMRCSSMALSILERGRWPGNVAELHAALSHAARRSRSGVVQPDDLPAHCHATGPRTLSPLESLERDAIVAILAATNGDKLAAAKGLQVSRATIYRKIRRYGIDLLDLDE